VAPIHDNRNKPADRREENHNKPAHVSPPATIECLVNMASVAATMARQNSIHHPVFDLSCEGFVSRNTQKTAALSSPLPSMSTRPNGNQPATNGEATHNSGARTATTHRRDMPQTINPSAAALHKLEMKDTVRGQNSVPAFKLHIA